MAYLTDIEIAQQTTLRPITEIAKIAGIDEKYLDQYGKYKAKIDRNLLADTPEKNGKLICERDTCDTWDAENVHVANVSIKKGVNSIVLRLTRVNADAKFNLIFSEGETCATHVTHYASVNPIFAVSEA